MEEKTDGGEETFAEFLLSSARSTGFWSFVAAAVGVVTILAGAIFFLAVDELDTFGRWLLIAGFALLAISVAVSPRAVALFLIGRRGRYGTNVLVMTVAFSVIVILANFFLYHSSWGRWDVTATRVFTLAPQTVRVLDNLERPVRANVFMVPSPSQIDLVRQQTEDLLNEFARRGGKFTYRFIDPELDRKTALDYEVTDYPSVVFEDVDLGTLQTVACSGIPGLPGCLNFNEQEFVTGILIASGREQKRVYHLTGHKERSVTRDLQTGEVDDEGLDLAFRGLRRDNYLVAPLNLKQDPEVPEDAAALIIPGPQQDLDEEEARILSDYVKRGGRILALFDPGSPPSYGELFATWGLNIGTEDLADSVSNVSGNLLTPLVQRTNGQFVDDPAAEITKHLNVTFFPGATYISSSMPGADVPPHLAILPLALTTPASWVERDVEDVKFDPDADILGPHPLGVAVAASGTADETEFHPTAKFVIIGDSDFAKNFFFGNDDNGDLFLNSVAWLTEDYDLIEIRPKVSQARRLVVNTRERDFIKWSSWFLPPSVMLVLGAFVWWRRR